jgi:serine/threonine protein kinase
VDSRSDFPDEQLLQGCAEEFLIWKVVRHPNVVPFAGMRYLRDPQHHGWAPLLALYSRYAPSWELSPLIYRSHQRGASIPLPVVSALVAELLLGVHAIHTAVGPGGEALGMVHRQIEPRGILLGLDGTVRLRCPDPWPLWDRSGCAGPAATVKGMIPRYLPPELVRGLPADPRTDLYSCAALLWELLTGRRPLDADSELDRLHRAIQGGEEPPSRFRDGLPEGVDSLVMKGLSLRPEDRFQDAPSMLEALIALIPPASPGEVAAWAQGLGVKTLDERLGHSTAMPSPEPDDEGPEHPTDHNDGPPPGGTPYRDAPAPAPPPPEPPPTEPPAPLAPPSPRWLAPSLALLAFLLFLALAWLVASGLQVWRSTTATTTRIVHLHGSIGRRSRSRSRPRRRGVGSGE